MYERVPEGYDSPLLNGICKEFDPDWWFPEDFDKPRSEWYNSKEAECAKEVCLECPVREECLAYALLNKEEWGIWGGFTPPERQE